jgi:hypothetical protein
MFIIGWGLKKDMALQPHYCYVVLYFFFNVFTFMLQNDMLDLKNHFLVLIAPGTAPSPCADQWHNIYAVLKRLTAPAHACDRFLAHYLSDKTILTSEFFLTTYFHLDHVVVQVCQIGTVFYCRVNLTQFFP